MSIFSKLKLLGLAIIAGLWAALTMTRSKVKELEREVSEYEAELKLREINDEVKKSSNDLTPRERFNRMRARAKSKASR